MFIKSKLYQSKYTNGLIFMTMVVTTDIPTRITTTSQVNLKMINLGIIYLNGTLTIAEVSGRTVFPFFSYKNTLSLVEVFPRTRLSSTVTHSVTAARITTLLCEFELYTLCLKQVSSSSTDVISSSIELILSMNTFRHLLA